MRFKINRDGGLRELYRRGESADLWRRLERAVAKAFVARIKFIKAATDERDLRAMRSLNYEKLERNDTDHSLRLNDQWRLIVIWQEDDNGRYLWIDRIEDYH
jgi:proteic killer suppression protein